MNPFDVFNKKEIEQVNSICGILENRNYTKEEWSRMGNSISEDIMSKSSKNGDIDKARYEFNSILDKIENYREKDINY